MFRQFCLKFSCKVKPLVLKTTFYDAELKSGKPSLECFLSPTLDMAPLPECAVQASSPETPQVSDSLMSMVLMNPPDAKH